MIMGYKFYFSVFVSLHLTLCVAAQQPLDGPLHNADLLFQDLDCGPLCDAIEQVTQSYGGRHFSHIGLVDVEGDSVFVIEAIGAAVQKTPLHQFLARTKNEVLVGRVKPEFSFLLPAALDFAQKQLALPYDDAFLYGNGKYYCSELMYDAFKVANQQKDFFTLQPMTFKQPHRKSYFPVWVTYYQKLKMPIPEGALGINPGGISMSPHLDMFLYKNSLTN
jgi:hypothetical protein